MRCQILLNICILDYIYMYIYIYIYMIIYILVVTLRMHGQGSWAKKLSGV